jgi:hypothetical protein
MIPTTSVHGATAMAAIAECTQRALIAAALVSTARG